MEVKKSKKASLENKRFLFIEIGFVVAILLVFIAFEIPSKNQQEKQESVVEFAAVEEDFVPPTQDTPPPPPEEIKIPDLSDEIDIVDDDLKVEDNIINLEDEANLKVEIRDHVEEVVEEEEVEEEAVPFALIQTKPLFNGEDPTTAFSKWVNERLVYPEAAKENGIQGRVLISFTVGKDGKVTDIKVARGIDPLLDNEAKRVVAMSPKWTPGKQRDKAAKVSYTFPVIFQLR